MEQPRLVVSQQSRTVQNERGAAVSATLGFLSYAPVELGRVAPPALENDFAIYRLVCSTGHVISCVRKDGLCYLTGTDIVRIISLRLAEMGWQIEDYRKLEEGVFSDLRNLEVGRDAIMEEAKSPLLEALFHLDCVRSRKRQRLCSWFAVEHEDLLLAVLERDLRRTRLGRVSVLRALHAPATQTDLERISMWRRNLSLTRTPKLLLDNENSRGSEQRDDSVTPANASPSHPAQVAPSKERRYACLHTDCRATFNRREHLDRHASTKHKGERPFQCARCGQYFSRSDNMRIHERKHL